jgi:hypothetical protein
LFENIEKVRLQDGQLIVREFWLENLRAGVGIKHPLDVVREVSLQRGWGQSGRLLHASTVCLANYLGWRRYLDCNNAHASPAAYLSASLGIKSAQQLTVTSP